MLCSGCTLCCTVLNIPSTDSPIGELCKYCNRGKGCKIYDTRPQECKEFKCAYAQVKGASINTRPDKCGVVFERVGEQIFIGTIDPNTKRLKSAANGQISSFLEEGFSVILFHSKIKKPYIYPAKDHTPTSVWKTFQAEVATVNGRPNISDRSDRYNPSIINN